MNISEHMKRASQQLRAEGFFRTLAGLVMNQNEFGWIEGAMRRAEAREKLVAALQYASKHGPDAERAMVVIDWLIGHVQRNPQAAHTSRAKLIEQGFLKEDGSRV